MATLRKTALLNHLHVVCEKSARFLSIFHAEGKETIQILKEKKNKQKIKGKWSRKFRRKWRHARSYHVTISGW